MAFVTRCVARGHVQNLTDARLNRELIPDRHLFCSPCPSMPPSARDADPTPRQRTLQATLLQSIFAGSDFEHSRFNRAHPEPGWFSPEPRNETIVNEPASQQDAVLQGLMPTRDLALVCGWFGAPRT